MQPSKRKFQKPNPINLRPSPGGHIIISNTSPARSLFQQIPMAQQAFIRTSSRKRPIDKVLVNVVKAGVNATQVTTTLFTTTFPCTVVGLRWDMTVTQDAGVANGAYRAAIVIVRQGITVSQLAVGDGSTMFSPEQDIMAYFSGTGTPAALGIIHHYNGSTKTMRKLMGGDILMFIIKGEATNTTGIEGTIQFFCKT